MPGFAPSPPGLLESLGVVTGDPELLDVYHIVENVSPSGEVIRTRSAYFTNEEDLPRQLAQLLHGRAYIIDRLAITETSSSNPFTAYIAANKYQGLIIPARTFFIEGVSGQIHYRWTDDGTHWTEWITVYSGVWHSYRADEKCRFGEVQFYADTAGTKITLRATR